jgi:rare lipoprotein A
MQQERRADVGGARRLAIAGAVFALAMAGGLNISTAQTKLAPSPTGQTRYVIGKPYQFDGVWYRPAVDDGYDQTGVASIYPARWAGLATTSGEVYDQNAITAAHKTLPLPSMARVTNLENGRSIVLRINDRGPFVDTQIIELSPAAAELLGIPNQATARVRVQIMAAESAALAASLGGDAVGRSGGTVPPAPAPVVKVTSLPMLTGPAVQALKPVLVPTPPTPTPTPTPIAAPTPPLVAPVAALPPMQAPVIPPTLVAPEPAKPVAALPPTQPPVIPPTPVAPEPAKSVAALPPTQPPVIPPTPAAPEPAKPVAAVPPTQAPVIPPTTAAPEPAKPVAAPTVTQAPLVPLTLKAAPATAVSVRIVNTVAPAASTPPPVSPPPEPPAAGSGVTASTGTAPLPLTPAAVKALPVDLPAQIFIQTGAFKAPTEAEQLRIKLADMGKTKIVPTRLGTTQFNAVLLGPISSMAEAHRLLKQIAAMGYPDAVLIIE